MTNTTGYADSDLTFYMPVFRDLKQARWALKNLRRHYTSRVIVASDGDFDPRWKQLELELDIEFHYGVKDTLLWCRGLHVQKMLQLFLMKPTLWLVKIDTDTGIHRRFTEMPKGDQCGSVQYCNDAASIQGGCCILSRRFCECTIESGLLTAQTFSEELFKWCPSALATHWHGPPHIAEDWVLGFLGRRIGMEPSSFDEIYSTWKEYVPNHDLRYAVTHPCKDMEL